MTAARVSTSSATRYARSTRTSTQNPATPVDVGPTGIAAGSKAGQPHAGSQEDPGHLARWAGLGAALAALGGRPSARSKAPSGRKPPGSGEARRRRHAAQHHEEDWEPDPSHADNANQKLRVESVQASAGGPQTGQDGNSDSAGGGSLQHPAGLPSTVASRSGHAGPSADAMAAQIMDAIGSAGEAGATLAQIPATLLWGVQARPGAEALDNGGLERVKKLLVAGRAAGDRAPSRAASASPQSSRLNQMLPLLLLTLQRRRTGQQRASARAILQTFLRHSR